MADNDKQFDPAEMDKAANEAEQDLENLSGEAVTSVAEWFAKHYLKAGHKRLGRILVNITKNPGDYAFNKG